MTTTYRTISNVGEQIIRALARYKFLTISQMLRVGVGTTSVSYLRGQLKRLKNDRKHPLIGVIEYAATGPKKGGRYEYVYYLKSVGKKLLTEQLDVDEATIKIPIGQPQFHSQYHHRRMQVDFQIALHTGIEKAGGRILWYDNDFDTIGSNKGGGTQKLEARTKIIIERKADQEVFIIPDGAFVLDTPKGEKLYLAEFHRTGGVERAVKQLYWHGVAICKSLPSHKYDFPKGNRVLMVCEQEVTMHSIMRKMNASSVFAALSNHFLFKTMKQVEEDEVEQRWHQFTGTMTSLW